MAATGSQRSTGDVSALVGRRTAAGSETSRAGETPYVVTAAASRQITQSPPSPAPASTPPASLARPGSCQSLSLAPAAIRPGRGSDRLLACERPGQGDAFGYYPVSPTERRPNGHQVAAVRWIGKGCPRAVVECNTISGRPHASAASSLRAASRYCSPGLSAPPTCSLLPGRLCVMGGMSPSASRPVVPPCLGRVCWPVSWMPPSVTRPDPGLAKSKQL